MRSIPEFEDSNHEGEPFAGDETDFSPCVHPRHQSVESTLVVACAASAYGIAVDIEDEQSLSSSAITTQILSPPPPPSSSSDATTHNHTQTEDKPPASSTTIASSSLSRRRKVRFLPKTKVHHIPHINDLPSDVIATTWYNRSECNAIKKSYMVTVRMIMAGHVFTSREEDTNAYCTRGLEYRTKEGARFKQKIKIFAMLSVMDEQDRQRQEGMNDPELLAQTYRNDSEKAASRAFVRGLKDELDIQEYLQADLSGTVSSSSSFSEEGEGSHTTTTSTTEAEEVEHAMVEISLEGPCPEEHCNDKRSEPQDSSNSKSDGNPNPGHSLASSSSATNILVSPTKQKRNRLLRGMNVTSSSATSSRRQEVLDDIESVRKEKKQLRRHLCGAAA